MEFEKIPSFSIDHIKLKPGLYVSRKDVVGNSVVTTFDIRVTSPNDEPVMNTAEVHAFEHLGATFLRNHSVYKDKILYFGPMGCRTGCYLLMFGDLTAEDVADTVCAMCRFILSYEGKIPGAEAAECGNFLDQNLSMAKFHTARFLDELTLHKRYVYPE